MFYFDNNLTSQGYKISRHVDVFHYIKVAIQNVKLLIVMILVEFYIMVNTIKHIEGRNQVH